MLDVFLFLCLLAPATAAYRVAKQMTSGDVLEMLGLGGLVFFLLLYLPMFLGGLVNRMMLLPVVMLTLLLSLGLGMWAKGLPRLKLALPPVYRSLSGAEFAGIALGLILLSLLVGHIWHLLGADRSLQDFDMVMFHTPNMRVMIEARTWWTTEGLFLYYPQTYELFLAWGLLLYGDFALFAPLHFIPIVMMAVYAALITRWALPDWEGAWRLVGEWGAVVGVLSLNVVVVSATQIGKNDGLIAAMVLASFYYWLRGWENPTQKEYFVLIGINLGIILITKFNGVYWVGALVGLHVLRRGLKKPLWEEGFLMGLPMVLLAFPWYFRLLRYQLSDFDRHFIASGRETMILNMLDTPALQVSYLGLRFFAGLLVLTGLLAILPTPPSPISRGRQLVALLFVAIIWSRFAMTDWTVHGQLLLLVLSLLACGFLILGTLKPFQQMFSERVRWVAGIALVSWGLFFLTPFAALPNLNNFTLWPLPEDYILDLRVVVVMYRYVLFAPILSWVAIWLTVLTLLRVNQAILRQGLQRVSASGYFMVVGVVLVYTLVARSFEPPADVGGYANQFEQWEYPTKMFDWARDNLRDTSVYVVGPPPTFFMGQDASNRVFYRYPDSVRDDWEVIETEKIIYLVVGQFPEDYYLPPEEILIAEAHERAAEVVFEDEQAIIFRLPD